MVRFDHRAVVCLAPIAQWIIFRALDDLLIDLIFLFRRKPFMWPRDAELAQAGERRIAMLVPLWHEHRFIGEMLEHNLAAILYGNHDFFGWCVPNDALPLQAGDRIARSDARVHLALCRHDGPTSKGDCLNSTSNAMAGYEQRHGIEFKIVVIHEAEDLVHPQALQLINWFSQDIKWMQVPVLPLATGLGEWTHLVY